MVHNTALVGYTSASGMDLFFFRHLQSHQSFVVFLGKGDKARFLVYTLVASKQQQEQGMAPLLVYI